MSLVARNIMLYAREVYSILTGLGKKVFAQSESPILPPKSQMVDP